MAQFVMLELLNTNAGIQNIPSESHLIKINMLLDFLNDFGQHFDMPIIVTSGYRSKEVNKAVGGVDSSHHTLGYACDMTCKNVVELRDFLKTNYLQSIDLLIYYPNKNFVHVSIHPLQRHQYFEK